MSLAYRVASLYVTAKLVPTSWCQKAQSIVTKYWHGRRIGSAMMLLQLVGHNSAFFPAIYQAVACHGSSSSAHEHKRLEMPRPKWIAPYAC